MRKAVLTFLTILILHTGFGQTNNNHTNTLDSISRVVIHYLQAKQADSIYTLGGENFKSHLTAASFKLVAENQVFKINDFMNTTFVSTTNGINKYRVAGTPELQLLIGLDKENKLETLLIQPFSNN